MIEYGSVFLRELRRRKVLRTGLYYLIACLLVLFLAQNFFLPGMGPDGEQVYRLLLGAAVLGFPLVCLLSWSLQVTPRGIVRTTSFVERRVLRNMAPINDQRHGSRSGDDAPHGARTSIRWIITAETGPLQGLQYGVAQAIEMGRSIDCAIAIVSQHVAPRHARLDIDAGQLVVEDLGSTTGTYVNGKPIEGRHILGPGDELRLYDVIFRVSENTPG
tara:strand:+ start:41 stop:691 length:651 start_codon:yes stop_codon:yes gene_type:complete